MSAPGSTNPLRKATFDNLQLNAGMFVKNLVYGGTGGPTDAATLKTLLTGIKNGSVTDKGEILGATRGGGTFTVAREQRDPEVDGMRYKFKGGTFIDSVDAYLSTTVVEVTADNFASLLGGTVTTTGKLHTIKMETALGEEDYLTNVCWIGDISDGRYVLICLKNAINTADFTLTFSDKSEGTLAVEFHATQADVNDYDEAPFEVVFFDKAA